MWNWEADRSCCSHANDNLSLKDREIKSLRRQVESVSEDLQEASRGRDIAMQENRRLQDDLSVMTKENHVRACVSQTCRLFSFFWPSAPVHVLYKEVWEIVYGWYLLLSDLYETVQKTVFRWCPFCFDFPFGCPWDNLLRLADFFFPFCPGSCTLQGSVGNRLWMIPTSFWSLQESAENRVQTMLILFWFSFWVSMRQPTQTCRLFFFFSFCPGTCPLQGSMGNRLRMIPASFWSLRESAENRVQTMPVLFWFSFWVSMRQHRKHHTDDACFVLPQPPPPLNPRPPSTFVFLPFFFSL